MVVPDDEVQVQYIYKDHDTSFQYNDWNALGDVQVELLPGGEDNDATKTTTTGAGAGGTTRASAALPPEAWPQWRIVRRIHYVLTGKAPQQQPAWYAVRQVNVMEEYVKWKRIMHGAPRPSRTADDDDDEDASSVASSEEESLQDDDDDDDDEEGMQRRRRRRTPRRYEPSHGRHKPKKRRTKRFSYAEEDTESSDDETTHASDLVAYTPPKKQESEPPHPTSQPPMNLELGQVTLHADPLSPNVYALHFLPSPNPLGMSVYHNDTHREKTVCLQALQWRRLDIAQGQAESTQVPWPPVKGDVVQSIDGVPIAMYTPEELQAFLLTPNPNQPVTIVMQRTAPAPTTTTPSPPVVAQRLQPSSPDDYPYYELCIPIVVNPVTGRHTLGLQVGPCKPKDDGNDDNTKTSPGKSGRPFSTEFQALQGRDLAPHSNVTPQRGDIVTQVNTKSTFGLTHGQVVTLLKQVAVDSTTNAVVRVVLRPPTAAAEPPTATAAATATATTTAAGVEYDVLVTMTDRGLGLVLSHVAGKAALEKLHPFAVVDYPSSPPAGALQEGDVVVAIDHVSVQDKTYEDIIEILKQPGDLQQRYIRFQRRASVSS